MSGSLDNALSNLATSLADVAAFRTWTATTMRITALAKIYTGMVSPPAGENYTVAELQALRPYALIWSSEFHRSQVAVGQHDEGGTIMLQLVDDQGPSETDLVARSRMTTLAADVSDGLLALAGGAGYLNIETIDGEDGGEPGFGHPDDVPGEGKAVWVQLRVNWKG